MAASTRKRESKQNQREILETIKQKSKLIIQSRKNVNNIIDIFEFLESEEAAVVQASIKALEKVFNYLITNCALSEHGPPLETAAEKQVREWTRERYSELQDSFLKLLASEQVSVQENALVSLMQLVQAEGQYPTQKSSDGKEQRSFPIQLLEKIMIKTLDLNDEQAPPVLTRFQEFIEYEDVLFHLLRVLGQILKKNKKDVDEKFLKNMMQLMEHITLRSGPLKGEEKPKLFCFNERQFNWNYPQAKKYFSSIWQAIFKYPLTPSLYKQVLILLPEKVLPHLEKPLLLTDFLMESYAIGGSVSILALHGVFLLMQNHNLEYPDFYAKLYALIDSSILSVKYRARFFHLLDLFMTSTHVPEYIAAAFAKKLSRLALIAPPNVAVLLLHFVGNLMHRHRGLIKLAHNPDNQTDVINDPFVMEERNLSACKATESSFWELKSLQFHVLPEVAFTAKFIDRELPKLEWDISQDLELTMEDLLEKELKRKSSEEDVPLNFEKPAKFACMRNDRFSEFFDFA